MRANFRGNIFAFAVAMLIAITALACTRNETSTQQSNASQTNADAQQPTIEAAPVAQGNEQWKVATSDQVTLTVTAPGAQSVRILYRPVYVEDRMIQLAKLDAPSDRNAGKFTAQVNATQDFAGEVWADVFYPNGRRRTSTIALTTENAIGSNNGGDSANNRSESDNSDNRDNANRSNVRTEGVEVGDDESARSDYATGGRIERASFREGVSDVRITVNVPAFQLTLWQDGKEIKTYDIGIGRKNFPIVIGKRQAREVILNPAWIPPDSQWVRESSGIEPYERITADDERNPLGKIKIPLGDAYLIHEAAKPSDIGALVSHGCIRMLREDIFDLSEKLATARGIENARERIKRARDNTERDSLRFDSPITVDINYDTHVVEEGSLYLYPDVYERDTNTIEKLREELARARIDRARLDDETLRRMMERTSSEQEFVVRIADIRAGRAPDAGQRRPLTSRSERESSEESDGDERSRER